MPVCETGRGRGLGCGMQTWLEVLPTFCYCCGRRAVQMWLLRKGSALDCDIKQLVVPRNKALTYMLLYA